MKRTILFIAAAILLFIADVSPGWGQVKPTSGNPYVLWEYDWVMGLQLHEIQNCDLSSDESILAVLSCYWSGSVMDPANAYISIIETNTGRFIDSIHIIGGSMLDIKFYNDSTVIVSYNGRLRFYNIHTKQMVREIEYKRTFSIQQFAITNDKKYLAISTVSAFAVFDIENSTFLMEKVYSDFDYYQNPDYNSYTSCRFINKKNTLLVVNGIRLLEFDFKRDTLINTYDLSVIPAYWNLDVSDNEEMVTYAEAENLSAFSYILNMKTNNIEKIATGETDNYCTWSNFLFKDKFLQLNVSQIDKNKKRLFSIIENKLFDVELPRLTSHNLRSKITNKFIIYGQSRIAYIDGDYFLTDVNNVEKKLETLLHPNPGTNAVIIDINLKEAGLYSLKIANNNGNIVKQQNYGYLESGNNHLIVQVSDLIPGAYFLTLTNGKETYNFKLVKE